MTQILEIYDMDFTAITEIPQWVSTNRFENNEKLGIINKEIEDTQKNWIKILELKHKITKIKIQCTNAIVE